jgi:hypothetical protein
MAAFGDYSKEQYDTTITTEFRESSAKSVGNRMIVYIHGFDWRVYAECIMPAIQHWLVDTNETDVLQLYKQTRCAQEEQATPGPIQLVRTWTRAQAFVKQLPRGPHSHREYQKLCSAEEFTALSDTYVHRYPPQLYQHSEALRTVWGALIEEYCLPWRRLFENGESIHESFAQPEPTLRRGELIALLQSAGLHELAQNIRFQTVLPLEESNATEDEVDTSISAMSAAPIGICIGQHPTPLHLRGWLATYSIRAMALFELLAFGRRTMPFGYQAGIPYNSYIGYITPEEVGQISQCLQGISAPDQASVSADQQRFLIREENRYPFRMIDEVLPAYADTFLTTVHIAAQQGLGLICSIE